MGSHYRVAMVIPKEGDLVQLRARLAPHVSVPDNGTGPFAVNAGTRGIVKVTRVKSDVMVLVQWLDGREGWTYYSSLIIMKMKDKDG